MYNYFQLQLHRSEQTEICTTVINGWVVRLEIFQIILLVQILLPGPKTLLYIIRGINLNENVLKSISCNTDELTDERIDVSYVLVYWCVMV